MVSAAANTVEVVYHIMSEEGAQWVQVLEEEEHESNGNQISNDKLHSDQGMAVVQ